LFTQVIQLGRLSGFSPIITTASVRHADYLKTLGATHIIDRRLPHSSLHAEVKTITESPIKFVYDAVSTPGTQEIAHDLLANSGGVVVVLTPHVRETDGKETIHVFSVPKLPHTNEMTATMYKQLSSWLDEGVIRVSRLSRPDILVGLSRLTLPYQPNRVEILPLGLESVVEGLERLETGQVSGAKLVVRPQFTANARPREKLHITTNTDVKENEVVEKTKQLHTRRSLFRRLIPQKKAPL
jgi:threonine dehydrogenase-like Zn-dependent dehydrogenase